MIYWCSSALVTWWSIPLKATRLIFESAKLRALCVTLLTCLVCSRVKVSCMLTCSHANVPCVLMCSRAIMFCVLNCSRAKVLCVILFPSANAPSVLMCLTCQHTLHAYVITCQCVLRAHMPTCLESITWHSLHDLMILCQQASFDTTFFSLVVM